MTRPFNLLRGMALCSATLLFGANSLHAQAGPSFPCDGNIYQVQAGQLRIFDPITSTYTDVGPQNGSYNATGFNILDNYAYASQGGDTIIRISANGVIENVFNIGFGSFSGDVDYSNNYYLRRNNNRYARINLVTGAVVDVDFAGPGGGPADVAFVQDGATEYLIGFAGANGGTMYRYNITTQTKENISLPGLPSGGFGAAWTDSTGRLFTFNNGNGLLYEVTDFLTNSPTFTQVGVGDPSGNNDGFSCSLAPFPNLAPLAFDDDFTGPLNVDVTGNVLPDNGNGADNDPEGFALTINTTPLSGPTNGTVVLNADGSFVYTPSTNFIGVDTFDYEVSDTSGLTATATVTITITGTIDFTLVKTQVSPAGAIAAAGDEIEYEIVLENIGDIPLTGLSISDVLPDGANATLGAPVEAGGTGTTAIGQLDTDETWTYTATYTATQDDIDGGGPLVNEVSATSAETGADVKTASASTTVAGTTDFTIVKTADPAQVSAPGLITYEITIENEGTVSLTEPDFTDVLTQNGTGLPLTSGPTLSGDTDGDNELDPTETWVYAATFEATQDEIDNGASALENTATMEFAEIGPLSASDDTTILQTAGMEVNKTSDTASLAAPGLITYEISVENTGNVTLTNVVPGDTLTQGGALPLTSGPLLVSGDDNSNGALDLDEIWIFEATFEVTQDEIDNGADIVNSVTVTSDQPATDSASTNTEILTNPSYTIAKSVDLDEISEPETLSYQVVIENTGNVSLTGVSLSDNVAQNAFSAPLTPPAPSGDADGDGEIDPGEIWVYALTFDADQARINDGGDIINTASFTTTELPAAQSASATTTVTQTDSLTLAKAVAAGQPTSFSNVGDTIDFLFTVTNTGNTTILGDIIINDDQIDNPATLVCSNADLAPGTTIDCTFTWEAEQADIDAGSVTNTATAAGTLTGGAGITSPPQQATVTANQTPAMSLDKTIVPPLPGAFAAGEILNYEFLVVNTGNVTLPQPVIVNDNITTVNCPAVPAGGLEPQGTNAVGPTNSIVCTAAYTISANDLLLGSTTNVAYAETTLNGDPVVSPTDSEIFPVAADPVLDLVKLATPLDTPINSVGDEIEYDYTVTNQAPAGGLGASLTEDIFIIDDKFPNPLLCRDASALGDLLVGQSHTCTFTYAVTQADLDAGEVVNEAVAQTIFAPLSPNPIDVSSQPDTETVVVDETPSLELVKAVTAGPSPAAEGNDLTYQIVATNNGNQTLTNVTVTDPLLPALDCGVAPITLAPTDTVTCTGTYTVTQDDIDTLTAGTASPVLTNTATVAANDPSGAAFPPVDASNDHPLEGADPSVTIVKELFPDPAADPAFSEVGDILQYRMTVTNDGNVTLSSVAVTDSLVTGTTCTVGPLAPGDTDQTCFFSYTIDQDDIDAGEVLNTATATAQPIDPGAPTVEGTAALTSPGPDAEGALTVLKAGTLDLGPDGVATPGDLINYTITVTNTGNVTLTDIVVSDSGADAGSIAYAAADDPDNDLDINTLAPDADAIVTATHALTQEEIDAGSFSNSAAATGQDPNGDDITDTSDSGNPGDGAGEDDPTVTPIPRGPAMTIVKTPSALTGVVVGQVIEYEYLVTNTGNVTLTNIQLDDQHTSAAGTAALDIEDGGLITALDPGDDVTLTAEYTVTQADIDAGDPLTNIVSGSADGPDGTTGPTAEDDASVDTATQAPSMEVVKTVQSISGSRAGDEVVFEIAVENDGNVSISDLVLTETLTRLDATPITPAPVPVFDSGDTGAQPDILDVDETWIYLVTYELTQEDVDAGGVSNSVLVEGLDPLGGPVDDTSDDDGPGSDPTEALIPAEPSFDVIKTAGTPSRVSGDVFSITFKIIAENTGNVTQNNVSMIDDLTSFLGPATLDSATIISFVGPATVAQNTGYNGLGDPELLAPGGILAVEDSVTLEIEVIYDGSTGAPLGTNTVSVSSDEQTTPATASISVDAQVADAAINANKSATPTNPILGDLVTYTIFFENQLNTIEPDLTLVDALPVGLVYQDGTALYNGAATPAPVRNGNLLEWGPVSLDPGETVAIQFQARVIGGGGTYVNEAYALNALGEQISPTATAVIEVRPEAVFDCSDVIGKVFDDVDGNGQQSRDDQQAEPGLAGVKVVTTRGTIITTDEHGRYSVPCAELPSSIGSNFTLKLDPRSLPTGYRVTTENPRVIRLTKGKMARLNFGARLGNVLDIDVAARAFAVEDGRYVLKPAFKRALVAALTQIKSNPTALRISYISDGESYKVASRKVDLVEDFIEKSWRGVGRYRLKIERAIVDELGDDQ